MITQQIQFDLTTEALAERIGLRPASIRSRMSRTGSYFGLIPKRLPNGRLLWPADAPERLTTQTCQRA